MINNLVNHKYEINKKTGTFCITPKDIVEEIGNDLFLDILAEAFETVEGIPAGIFIEADISQNLYRRTKTIIVNQKEDLQFISKQLSDSGELINSMTISMVDYVLELLNQDYEDCFWAGRIGRYIEACFLAFVETASWHVGFYNENTDSITPIENNNKSAISEKGQIILWYGLDRPIFRSPWVIAGDTENLSFWFIDDPWTFLESISDLNHATLIWYTEECCYWLPDIEAIRKECPVVFSPDESGKTVIDRVRCNFEKK